ARAGGEECDLRQGPRRPGDLLLHQPLFGLLEQALAPLPDALAEKIPAVAGETEQLPQIQVHGCCFGNTGQMVRSSAASTPARIAAMSGCAPGRSLAAAVLVAAITAVPVGRSR